MHMKYDNGRKEVLTAVDVYHMPPGGSKAFENH